MIFFNMYCSNFSSMKIENSKKYRKNGIQFYAHVCPNNNKYHKVWGDFKNLGREFMVPTKTLLLESLLKSFQGSLNLLDKTTPKKIPRSCKIAYTTIQRLWNVNLFVPRDYACANGTNPSFGFCATIFVITCHLENFHLLPWKTKLITTKNWKLTHVTLKNHTMTLWKLPLTNLRPWFE
jgi:hypothetical protein